jgi:hypothetical protein
MGSGTLPRAKETHLSDNSSKSTERLRIGTIFSNVPELLQPGALGETWPTGKHKRCNVQRA